MHYSANGGSQPVSGEDMPAKDIDTFFLLSSIGQIHTIGRTMKKGAT